MAFRFTPVRLSMLIAGAALLVAALPTGAGAQAPAQSCRVASVAGSGQDMQIRYAPDCRAVQSRNVVRKGYLEDARAYGDTPAAVHGGGRVIGWEGGREGGPVYEPRNAPGAGASMAQLTPQRH